ncbi:serine protease [Paremcibacter congregatus]|uniref:Probable periplasmic serine endoprotease DegP-like n=2 Tax=Paremcibacter congregatus TaxID=2043170 RepID=A0A2G4YRW5_9PROT|nr:serine protease [Paremcibacter congregatus]QDE29121.1 DegQ family serine endoprotease [Paremcibacter congregatus]
MIAPLSGFASGAPDSFADLAEKLLPAVVNVNTTEVVKREQRTIPQIPGLDELFRRYDRGRDKDSEEEERPTTRQSLGSGFVIDPSGIIVTNNHVIDKADEIMIKMHDGREFEAKLIGKDDKLDLAVLKVESDKPLPYVKFGDDSKSRIGDWVLAIGNPYSLGGTITAGIISARNRDINSGPYDKYIQTDASINRGNSGGPMFNLDGEVIGINTAIFSPSGGNIGIGFAIPSNQAQHVIEQIQKFGHARRGRIGIVFQPLTDEFAESLGMEKGQGALVTSVVEGGPADKAGIESDDIIIEYEGKAIKTRNDLPIWVANTPIGKKVKLVVLRKGKRKNLTLVIDELVDEETPDDAPMQPDDQEQDVKSEEVLGMTLENLTEKSRKALRLEDDVEGVLVASVKRNSPAGEKGLRRGDVILSVTQEDVKTIDQVTKRVAELRKKGRKSVLLKIIRRGNTAFVAVQFDPE